ncbi:type I DNA topoisomerase [Desulfovibrio litoralis]|uniref:DNA topoisomerase 1 n=1 Tax=Desulfovibrio litoralis DSM 11393 TaxID=1121455 RepID=A0A1M7S9A4_9BACT|nr:type I DNA topoisomerase [Desulfovibrio litoralis]SHN54965.1 DNA topoisomerase I [Desulfovibrio litoralis DSM 11393]
MSKDLIIVESPAKVKTIKKFLGNKYAVHASVGHIRDLPSKELGVDENNSFEPHYEVIKGKEKIVQELRRAASGAENVYLAPDPDREGEAIAWHIAELIKDKNKHFKRIQFNEITAKAVKEALEHPREINQNLFHAQQARRVLDRLVGYKISPILWKKVKRGISAGRVQSVALRIIVERERERLAFVPEEYWNISAELLAATPPPVMFALSKYKNKKAVISSGEEADALEAHIKGKPFIIEKVEEKERERQPQPPYITSTLQQSANQRLGYPAKRTMNIAQKLYEGVDLGERGITALITYMRTDSVRISDEARKSAETFIIDTFGAEYYPKKARYFKGKNSAQDAHEAVRPVDVNITPEELKGQVSPEQYQLYKLIWSRFVASQMAAARFHDTNVTVKCNETEWKAKGERLLFPGFLKVNPQKEDAGVLPPLKEGDELKLQSLKKEQKFTQPPARYSEASLVRELEEKGIGRPSTYASIISTLMDREYVYQDEKHFVPTELGYIICDKLTGHFSQLMDIEFTAKMENSLDQVAEGETDWVQLLQNFNADFVPALALAARDMESVKGGVNTDVPCPQCGKPTMIKFGKAGSFLACSGYPDCSFTSNFIKDEQGNIQIQEREKPQLEVVGKCPDCGHDLVIKKARTGSRFIACSNYPNCKHAEPFSTGVKCPNCEKGMIVEKSSKKGKLFYACDQYPNCDLALWDYPVPERCPLCDNPILVKKQSKAKGLVISCPNKSCRYSRSVEE